MARVDTPELVAAVSESGGLGSLGGAMMSPDDLRAAIRRICELTQRPFAVNLFAWSADPDPADEARAKMHEHLAVHRAALGLEDPELAPPPPLLAMLEDQVAVIAEERVPVFSVTFGIPPLDGLREAGTAIIGTATTTEEAVALEDAGVDAVVAQGSEAGGHRGAFLGAPDRSLVGLMALVPQIVDRVALPVIAAGAIMDGRGIAAALALGAEAVQLGTAFLVTEESGAPSTYKRLVLESRDDATTVTAAYSGRAARTIRTSLIDELEASGLEIPPHPLQAILTRPLHEAGAERDRGELMFLLSGQAGGLARSSTAGELMRRLVVETEDTLSSLGR